MTRIKFLEKIKPFVVADMKASGILASLTAAQACIESRNGTSGLTQRANNLFGIKGTYNGQSVRMLTPEYIHHKWTEVYADFRKYPSWQESIVDHSSLFNRLSRYKNLRGCKDYKKACKYVQADGYCTSPTYANTLIQIIEKYKLYEWDMIEAQNVVSTSDIDKVVSDVIKGIYGNGQERRAKIEALGYDYKEIQKLVNARLKG